MLFHYQNLNRASPFHRRTKIRPGRACRQAERAWCGKRRRHRRPGGKPSRGHEKPQRIRKPGGRILYTAHAGLEMLTLDKDTMHYKEGVAAKYAGLVYDGKWFCPLREALAAFVAETQKTVTGTVRMKLYKNNCRMSALSPLLPVQRRVRHLRRGRGYTTTRMRRASLTCSACRSRCAPSRSKTKNLIPYHSLR